MSESTKPTPGLLTEDTTVLEVRTNGKDELVRTNDRAATAKALTEADGHTKPVNQSQR